MTATAASKAEMSKVARHIARVAARLFAERGYDATSVREIVAAAGIAKPTLYYYFRSKEGLASALLTRPLANLVSSPAPDCHHHGGSDSLPRASHRSPVRVLPRGPGPRAVYLCLAVWPPRLGACQRAGAISRPPGELDRIGGAPARRSGACAQVRVEACSIACRGFIVISTMDFLYRESSLGGDLARRHVDDLLNGFGSTRATDGRDAPG